MATEPSAPDLNLLPEYYRLLRNAFNASETVDNYDLRSEDHVSVQHWTVLVAESTRAQMELIDFVWKNYGSLSFQVFGALLTDSAIKV